MMKALHVSLLFLSLLGASAPPDDVPPPIQFPIVTLPPQPAPAPQAQPTLTPGVVYPVVCRVPCVVRAYPAGLVTIRAIPVPSGETFHAERNFIDGTKDRTWKGPLTVYFIECDVKASRDGSVDIVATPFGFKLESEIVTSSVYVDNKKQPKPNPDPAPPRPTKLWGLVYVEETGLAVAERGRLLADTALATYMKNAGLKFRVVDQHVIGTDGKPPADVKRFLDASAGKPLAQMFIVAADGSIVTSMGAVADPAEVIQLLKKWSPP